MKTLIKHLLKKNILFMKLFKKTIWIINGFRNKIHLFDSEYKLASDNQNFWNKESSNPDSGQNSHWKDKGIFEDQKLWLMLGKENLDMILKYSSVLSFQFPVKQIIEWGCGGGANAVHFAPLTEKFIGIDIISESLTECNKQVLECGLNNFHPVLIDASDPESVLKNPITEADLFISTYVYEIFPSPAYGLTILKLANKMLKNGGIAFIQIRYNDGRKLLKPKRWGYKFHAGQMTTYSIEEFWENSKKCGFEPLGIYLMPNQPLVHEHYYAYFFLKNKIY